MYVLINLTYIWKINFLWDFTRLIWYNHINVWRVESGYEARYGHRYGIFGVILWFQQYIFVSIVTQFMVLSMCMSSKDWLVKVFAA